LAERGGKAILREDLIREGMARGGKGRGGRGRLSILRGEQGEAGRGLCLSYAGACAAYLPLPLLLLLLLHFPADQVSLLLLPRLEGRMMAEEGELQNAGEKRDPFHGFTLPKRSRRRRRTKKEMIKLEREGKELVSMQFSSSSLERLKMCLRCISW